MTKEAGASPLRTVHKFGGASVKDADAIRRIGDLLGQHLSSEEQAVVVVSAMGKTTNALEAILEAPSQGREVLWQTLVSGHLAVSNALELGPECARRIQIVMEGSWQEFLQATDPEMQYDALVAAGELASTTLVQASLAASGVKALWWDVRDTLQTDGPHRFARVEESGLTAMGQTLRGQWDGSDPPRIVVTQGFIGRHSDGRTSTLGREGSDYSAALLAVAAHCASVTIWKDVPGMMNADPKRHPEAVTVPRVDHAEAVELSYYGAGVIHPRTIKPLQQSGLSLKVRSFVHPTGPSTHIDAFPGLVPDVPMFIWRDHQVWLEVSTADQSFLAEDHLKTLFEALHLVGLHVRLMQQSATHFGLVMDRDDARLSRLEQDLAPALVAQRTEGLQLLTVRHGDAAVLDRLTEGKDVLIEQRTQATWRRLLR